MADYEFTGLGYRRDLEDVEGLKENAQSAGSFYCGDIDPRELGKPIGMIDVLRLENQYQENSCGGNSLTTICEGAMWHQSGGQVNVQLSRQFAYVNGQRYCNLYGDVGVQLKGALTGFQKDGCPLEVFAPYTGTYYTQFSNEARANAQNYKLAAYLPITTVDQAYEVLAKRVGGIYAGINWTNECRNPLPGGFINHFQENAPDWWGEIPGGFHAIAFMDWCEEKDSEGYPRLRLFNSHGPNYGDRGTSKWSRAAFASMLSAPNTICYAVSDMAFIKPRFDFKQQHWTDYE